MVDRLIRATTALAVAAVAAVAAVISYRHAYELVTTHGETGLTARLLPFTVDGLILRGQHAHPGRQPTPPPCATVGTLVPGRRHRATIGANLAHGLGHGPVGALVSAWPALALAGSFELLMTLIRTGPHAETTAIPTCHMDRAALTGAHDAPPVPAGTPTVKQTVRAWHSAGRSQRAIARDLGIDRRKIKRIIATTPSPLPHQRASAHDLYCRDECASLCFKASYT